MKKRKFLTSIFALPMALAAVSKQKKDTVYFKHNQVLTADILNKALNDCKK